ncbi:MAG: endonuclease domain-containing protein [Candidatus Magasanikbacteria bacterium]|nr:endonuclease domain-containing protein [Candidatus Magasanikbacteria bacterium]
MTIKRTYQNEPTLKDVRRFLRAEGTSAEKILWKYIRKNQLGYKFRRQFSIGNFVADFYCHELKLIIELDGWTHDSSQTKIKDLRKQQFFEGKGYTVIRLTNEEIYGDPEKFIARIKEICDKLSKY